MRCHMSVQSSTRGSGGYLRGKRERREGHKQRLSSNDKSRTSDGSLIARLYGAEGGGEAPHRHPRTTLGGRMCTTPRGRRRRDAVVIARPPLEQTERR